MRHAARILVTAALLAASVLSSTAVALPQTAPSIPVGAITDLGDLTKVAYLGNDVSGLLGR